ncbi:hypothetical protein [Streptomyces sp. NPDC101150]|uniref:hypothetical protein n=1 Tax=Streptomyces sp. NPDC101150 TaxID=3366114 RepID=UPI0038266820
MRYTTKVTVFKGKTFGKWVWACNVESCHAPDSERSGRASDHWEIAFLDASTHARDFHTPHERPVVRDMPTPPNGQSHVSFADDDTIVIPVQRLPFGFTA